MDANGAQHVSTFAALPPSPGFGAVAPKLRAKAERRDHKSKTAAKLLSGAGPGRSGWTTKATAGMLRAGTARAPCGFASIRGCSAGSCLRTCLEAAVKRF